MAHCDRIYGKSSDEITSQPDILGLLDADRDSFQVSIRSLGVAGEKPVTVGGTPG